MSLSFHLNNLIILGKWSMEQIALEGPCAPIFREEISNNTAAGENKRKAYKYKNLIPK